MLRAIRRSVDTVPAIFTECSSDSPLFAQKKAVTTKKPSRVGSVPIGIS
jgi:hypothetical protein